jgi:Sulfotransferase domain
MTKEAFRLCRTESGPDTVIRNLHACVPMLGRSTGEQPLFREAVARLQLYCLRHGMPARPIILTGYPKSGNTLTRLVYYNLIAATKTGATETMTYTRLNRVDPNHTFPFGLLWEGFVEPANFDLSGFPLLLVTHQRWEPFWDEVGDVLFIERHPLDSLIGHWHNAVAFPEEPTEDIDIDAFVLRELPDWIGLYHANKPHAKALLRYEAMMADAQRAFAGAFRALGVPFAGEHLKRAVAMSSFTKVRAMEDAYSEHHGHAADPSRRERVGDRAWKHAPGVRFTRSGQSGQWRDALKPETIERAMAVLREAGLVQYAAPADEADAEFTRPPRLVGSLR